MTSVPPGTHGPVRIAHFIAWAALQLNGQMADSTGIKTGNVTDWMAQHSYVPMAIVLGIIMDDAIESMALQLSGQMADATGIIMDSCTGWMGQQSYMRMADANGIKTASCTGLMARQLNTQTGTSFGLSTAKC